MGFRKTPAAKTLIEPCPTMRATGSTRKRRASGVMVHPWRSSRDLSYADEPARRHLQMQVLLDCHAGAYPCRVRGTRRAWTGGGTEAEESDADAQARAHEHLPFLMNWAGNLVIQLFSKDLSGFGLTVPMWRVLAVLEEEGAQRLTDLAIMTSIEVSTLSRLIAGMELRGLLTHGAGARQADGKSSSRRRLLAAACSPTSCPLPSTTRMISRRESRRGSRSDEAYAAYRLRSAPRARRPERAEVSPDEGR